MPKNKCHRLGFVDVERDLSSRTLCFLLQRHQWIQRLVTDIYFVGLHGLFVPF